MLADSAVDQLLHVAVIHGGTVTAMNTTNCYRCDRCRGCVRLHGVVCLRSPEPDAMSTDQQLGRIEVSWDERRYKRTGFKGFWSVTFLFSCCGRNDYATFEARKSPEAAAQRAIDWINSRRSLFSEYIEPELRLGDEITGRLRKGVKHAYRVIVPAYQ